MMGAQSLSVFHFLLLRSTCSSPPIKPDLSDLKVMGFTSTYMKLSKFEQSQGGNSWNFLRKICKIFITFWCFYEAVNHTNKTIYDFFSSWQQPSLISASKTTFSLCTPKISSPKVMNILRICRNNFCEFRPRYFVYHSYLRSIIFLIAIKSGICP